VRNQTPSKYNITKVAIWEELTCALLSFISGFTSHQHNVRKPNTTIPRVTVWEHNSLLYDCYLILFLSVLFTLTFNLCEKAQPNWTQANPCLLHIWKQLTRALLSSVAGQWLHARDAGGSSPTSRAGQEQPRSTGECRWWNHKLFGTNFVMIFV